MNNRYPSCLFIIYSIDLEKNVSSIKSGAIQSNSSEQSDKTYFQFTKENTPGPDPCNNITFCSFCSLLYENPSKIGGVLHVYC